MRRMFIVLSVAAMLPSCSFFRRAKLQDSAPAHVAPTSTSPFGDWVMFTDPDSTAFTGAERVDMNLTTTSFRIVAHYPGRARVTVSGTASLDEAGLLTLTPTDVGSPLATGNYALVRGQPVTVLASAADNTMVFAPADRITIAPSSVWHRLEKAIEAGTLAPTPSAARDSLER